MIDLDGFAFDDEHGYERQLNTLNRELVGWFGEELHPPLWRKSAACKGTDSSVFFIERGQTAKAAKAICAGCPVVGACLDFAIEENMRMGVFGGMTERERRGERQRRKVAGQIR